METAAFGAAQWLLGKALRKLSDNALEAWAATKDLGGNVSDLKKELLFVHETLRGTQGKDMSYNPELDSLLKLLGQLSDEAEDMLDELDYFRIQDQLYGTHEAADQPGDDLLRDAAFHARHAAVNVVTKWLPCLPAFDGEGRHFLGCASLHGGCMDGLTSAANTVGKSLLCCCSSCLPAVPDDDAQEPLLPAVPDPVVENLETEAPKLVFDRVGMSQNMERILGELRPMCAKVTSLLLRYSTNNRTTPPKRPVTTSRILEDKVFGREGIRDKIIAHMIGGVKHVAAKDDLSVFLIWGHGGMGKTTLAQYVYNDPKVNKHFDVKVWVCVSHDFDVPRLTREILTGILVYLGEGNSSPQGNLDQLQTQIEKKLESKKLLLVLDDVWQDKDKHGLLSKNIEPGWKQLIAPFKKGQMKGGNVIIVTSRFVALAKVMSISDDRLIQLTGLETDDFREYFYTCVSHDDESKPQDELKEIGDEIIKKLKGSPLAARTVGALLGTNLNARHWRQVLESEGWGSQKNAHDIMPALKLSFDYLPFHLQECFSFCALFPEDYKFGGEELIRFWLGAGIIYSNYDQNESVEGIGSNCLNELVDHGFLKRVKRWQGPAYIMHDLMHELAVEVSSQKYLSINSSNFKSTKISPSICHLSIFTINNAGSEDNFRKEFCELKKILKIENLQTLIFQETLIFQGICDSTFANIFREVKSLRVLHLSYVSDPQNFLFNNFSKLVHLRYLKLGTTLSSMSLPQALSRFYHLKVLDLDEWEGDCNLPRDISNLRKLRHFVANEEMHSSIVEVGKLECLQELKRFNVGTINAAGFELRQLGALMELRGSLSICNLKNVKNREEAGSAKLLDKSNLDKLKLVWQMEESNNKPVHILEETLEGLRPHPNLQTLHIQGHGGTTCPTWLDTNIAVKYLKSLCLYNVAWKTFPAFGQLLQLKKLELVEMNKLEKWVGGKTCHLFSNLEFLIVKNCPKLVEIPSSRHSSASTQDENNSLFPRLKVLEIASCPNLLVLPPTPCASTLCSIKIKDVGSYFSLEYSAKHSFIAPQKTEEFSLRIELKEHPSIDFQSLDKNMLAFHNLTKLEELEVKKCPPLELKHLQMLKSLKRLKIRECKRIILDMDEETNLNWQLPIEFLEIDECGVSGKELSQLLSYLPALPCLKIQKCPNLFSAFDLETTPHYYPFPSSLQHLELDGVEGIPSSNFSNLTSLTSLRIGGSMGWDEVEQHVLIHVNLNHWQVGRYYLIGSVLEKKAWESEETEREKGKGEEKEPPHLPPSSSSHPHPHPHVLWFKTDDLPGFLMAPSLCTRLSSSLQTLAIWYDDTEGFTAEQEQALQLLASLQVLEFWNCSKLRSVPAGLHRLRNLKRLQIWECPELRNGVAELLTQGNLMELEIKWSPNVFSADCEPSRGAAAATAVPNSSRLQSLNTDDIAGFLMAPSLCSLLSSSLQTFVFSGNYEVEAFTAEQVQALQLLTSLQVLKFKSCKKLRSLPAGLHRLRNLKRLEIYDCREIWSLPKEGLPSSLQQLVLSGKNSDELKRECSKLRNIPEIIIGGY